MSFSQFVFDRYKARSRRRIAASLIYVVAVGGYLVWRAGIFSPASYALSALYFTAETIGFVLGLVMIFCSWRYRHHVPKPAPENLKVDVFVPTYREPVSLVRWTVIAAKEISYPHQTFLLDDGNRPEMKALAEELGVRYFARERNIGAKAGNLNNGLAHSDAEFVMVLDADHIAMPHALDVTLGFFENPRVALVQTPEDFYNIDAFQFFNARRSGGLWHDQSFFYTLSEPSRDAYSGASCIGTGVVYRRSALDEIGGIPAATVTEDMHTSLKLHKAGHETLYLNEPVAYGIASADMRDYYNTRHRWAHGNLHGLRLERIFGRSKLTLAQRMSYLALGLNFLEGWQQLLLFVVPIVSLLFGLPPFDLTVLNVLIVFLFPVISILLLQEIGGGLARLWSNEIFSMARFPVHIVSWAALFTDRMAFRASSKSIQGRVDWKLLSPQLAVAVFSLFAVLLGVVKLSYDFKAGQLAEYLAGFLTGRYDAIQWTHRIQDGYSLDLLIVAGCWALFNAIKAVVLVFKALRDARHSNADYRFDTHFVLAIDTEQGRVLAHIDRMSKSWVSMRFPAECAAAVEKKNSGHLFVPSGSIPIHWRTQRVSSLDNSGFVHLTGTLILNSPADQERIMRSLYSVDWRREFIHRCAFFLTPTDIVANLIRLRLPRGTRSAEWWPGLYRDEFGRELKLMVVSEEAGPDAILVGFRDLKAGSRIQLEIIGRAGIERKSFEITGAAPRLTLGQKGFDGAEVHKFFAVEKTAQDGLKTSEIKAIQAGAAE